MRAAVLVYYMYEYKVQLAAVQLYGVPLQLYSLQLYSCTYSCTAVQSCTDCTQLYSQRTDSCTVRGPTTCAPYIL